jgi:hypothetical protein
MAHVKYSLFLGAQNVLKKSYWKTRFSKKAAVKIPNIKSSRPKISCWRWSMEKAKKVEFETADSLHKNWLNYLKKHTVNENTETLYQLLNSSHIARNDKEILDTLYDSVLAILESTQHLNSNQKTRALYFSYNLCSCKACQKECGAHINKKGQIRISTKFFHDTLNQETPPPAALLELMYTLLHQIIHGIFPELDEEQVSEKTEQVWTSGIAELSKDKRG